MLFCARSKKHSSVKASVQDSRLWFARVLYGIWRLILTQFRILFWSRDARRQFVNPDAHWPESKSCVGVGNRRCDGLPTSSRDVPKLILALFGFLCRHRDGKRRDARRRFVRHPDAHIGLNRNLMLAQGRYASRRFVIG
jgi:hypothetical protein